MEKIDIFVHCDDDDDDDAVSFLLLLKVRYVSVFYFVHQAKLI